jgi:Stage II sporulation protein E (SpoIIE)
VGGEAPAGTGADPLAPDRTPIRPHRPAWRAKLHGSTIVVVVIGVLITATATWIAWTLNSRTESRLLHLQTQQTAEVLLAAVPSTATPLATAAQIAGATHGSPAAFEQFMRTSIGSTGQFVSASLWESTASGVRLLASVGAPPTRAPGSPAAHSIVEQALTAKTFVVTGILGTDQPRLGYASALPGPGPRYIVYAEHTIPTDRKSTVANNSAFSELHYAIYLGTPSPAHLLTTDFPDSTATGTTDKVAVPFGDTTLTIVAGPVGQLGGALSGRLPWIFAVAGLLLTIGAAWITESLVRRRRRAEDDSLHIERLYTEQRTIAETLQRALLPKVRPGVSGLEVAVHYQPGARGVEIGGDWYSVVPIDPEHVGFVVGDVSGRGINAAVIMAELRFTIRTLLLEGNSPAAVLEKCSSQIDVGTDGHFATVLVGVADINRGDVVLASAGHFPPLLRTSTGSRFVDVPVGVPLGVVLPDYRSTTIVTPPGSVLVGFTDGLVERRGEGLDRGLGRLQAAVEKSTGSLEDLVDGLVVEVGADATEDDIAILALQWKDR